MTFIKIGRAIALTHSLALLLLSSSFAFAQSGTSVGSLTVSVILNGSVPFVPSVAAPTPPPVAGACATQTLFNQTGAVVRVTCVNNPFVSIAPSIDTQLPGTFGSTFRYPLLSNSNSFNLASAGTNSFNPVSSGLNASAVPSLFVEGSTPIGSNVQSTSGNNLSSRSFNSPTSTVTDLSIYRTAPKATTDAQGLMDMFISF